MKPPPCRGTSRITQSHLGDVVVQDADGRIVSGSIGNEFLVSADEADAFAADVVAAALELRALSVPTATFEP